MAIQTEDGITSPGSGDPFNPPVDLAVLAQTTQLALEKRANAYRGTSAQREASLANVQEGALWVDTNGDKALYTKQGSTWKRIWPIEVSPRVSSFLKAQSGWGTQPGKSNYIQRRGEWVYINWFFRRTGGTINVPASGDIANQTTAIVNGEWKPKTWQPLHSGESGRVAAFTISSNGEIRLNAVGGTSNISNGSVFQVRGWYNLTI